MTRTRAADILSCLRTWNPARQARREGSEQFVCSVSVLGTSPVLSGSVAVIMPGGAWPQRRGVEAVLKEARCG